MQSTKIGGVVSDSSKLRNRKPLYNSSVVFLIFNLTTFFFVFSEMNFSLLYTSFFASFFYKIVYIISRA